MLEARSIHVTSSDGGVALDDVSVFVHPGEVVAVVGPNGSGKSTLLRALAGLVAVRSGVVLLNGDVVTGLPTHRRVGRGMAYAPERGRVVDALSVRDNLLAGAWLRRDREAVARDLHRVLERFPPLQGTLRSAAARLTGAERQMLALGRALLSAPRVLLLDEPFLGLDPGARGIVLKVIRDLRTEGVAILLTAHGVPDAREIADRAYALWAGRVVFAGSAAALETASAVREMYA